MGVNFIKQFNGAGLGQEIALLAPGFSGDEDTIAAVGEPIKGLRNTAQWAADLDNPANRKFVEDFKKTYKRMPTLYASQGYDAAMLLDSAVRQTGGKLDADTLRPALRRADFKSVRGDFKFNRNQYPIQNYYLRIIEAGADGKPANKLGHGADAVPGPVRRILSNGGPRSAARFPRGAAADRRSSARPG